MAAEAIKSPHHLVREEQLATITDDRIRSIFACQYEARPEYEKEYYEYISTRPEYLEIYKHWVLSQSPYPMPNDPDLYRVREGILEKAIDPSSDGDTILINRRLLFFLIDMLMPFIGRTVALGIQYYEIPEDKKRSELLEGMIFNAAGHAIRFSSKEDVEREGYENFINGFMDLFKVCFSTEMESISISFPAENELFVLAFEREWERLLPYSDVLYGFEVMPAFSPADIFRYLRLPFTDKKFKQLSEATAYKQVMNYVSGMATFKPLPDSRIRAFYRNELCGLFTPLVEGEIRRVKNKRQFVLSDETLKIELRKTIKDLASNFEYFFATRNNIQKGKLAGDGSWTFPLRGQLVKLGHVSENDEYPFTAYVTKKLRQRMKEYFADDLPRENAVSLDDETGDFGDGRTLGDTISESSNHHSSEIPPYDARDADGKEIGWKIETFAGIVGKGASTLRRWDDEGIFPSKRYKIRSHVHGTVPFRFYTEEDIPKAHAITKDMEKRIRHQA